MAASLRKDFECIITGYPLRDYQLYLSLFIFQRLGQEEKVVARKLYAAWWNMVSFYAPALGIMPPSSAYI